MRVTGTVRWFDRLRAFGVIARGVGRADCFVRHTAMRGTLYRVLASGDRVEFDVVRGGAGALARDVVRLEGTPTPVRVEADE